MKLDAALTQIVLHLDGRTVPPDLTHALREFVVESAPGAPDRATLSFRDLHADLLDDERFTPGAALDLVVTARGRTGRLFGGEIVEIESVFDGNDVTLRVRALDRLHRLAVGTHTRVFRDVSDADLVRRAAREAGLRADVPESGPVYGHVVQDGSSNLDFLRDRLKRVGLTLRVNERTVRVEPSAGGEDEVDLTLGDDLTQFTARISLLGQAERATARGWDPDRKRAISGQASGGQDLPVTGERRRPERTPREALDLDAPYVLTRNVVRDEQEARRVARAEAQSRAARFLTASGVCRGDPRVRVGTRVRPLGVGTRLAGTYAVSSVTHRYHVRQGYRTEFTLGGSGVPSVSALLGRAAPPSGRGLTVGIVTNNVDPEDRGRVRVKLPAVSDEHETPWARIVTPGGGPGRGFQWLPDVDDEVLVGFEHGDVNHPYVLGGLYNGVDAPPLKTSEAVNGGHVTRRVLRSADGHTVEMTDGGEEPGVTVRDASGTTVRLDTRRRAVSVEAAGDVRVRAGGTVSLQGREVRIEAEGDVVVRGATIRLN